MSAPDGRRTLHGHGRLDGLMRPDFGPRCADLKCDECGATWVGRLDEDCTWCEDARMRLLNQQRQQDRQQGRPIRLVPDLGEDWPDPDPLGDPHDCPPFPIDALPDWIAAHVRQVADEFQFPCDLPAMLAITALSICCARHAEVVVQGTWREPLNTYSATAMPPGAGKSPAVRQMLGCLDRYEADLIERTGRERDEIETRRAILEKQRTKAINSGETAEALAISDELRDIPEAIPPRLMADDATPEKLAQMISEQDGRMALVSTEGGIFGLMTGRYSDKANLNVYLQSWSGDPLRVDRIGRKTMIVLDPALTVGVTVQPSVIAQLADTPELAGRGLTARFMYAFPPSNVGHRRMDREAKVEPVVALNYERQLVDLAERMAPRKNTDDIVMNAAARTAYFAWRQCMEDRCAPGRDLYEMTEWVTKVGSTVARLAGLLALAEETHMIDAEIMGRAITVGRYWEAHARIAHTMWGADVSLARAGRLLDWIAETTPETFTIRDACRSHRALTAEDVVDALEVLVESGWIRQADDQPLKAGRRGVPSPTFHPHPRLSHFRNNHVPMSHMSPKQSINLTSSSSLDTGMDGGPGTYGTYGHEPKSAEADELHPAVAAVEEAMTDRHRRPAAPTEPEHDPESPFG